MRAGAGGRDRAVAKYKPQNDNEAQTEADWIRPVLAALGHHFNVQVGMQTPLGAKVADYAFYPDEAARQAAKRGVLAEADFAGALAVGDAKAWERSLDRAAVKEVKTLHENPSLQIDTYIRHSGLAWGILTNGRLWRLYHKDTSKKLDVYYEVDLPALIEQGDAEAFKYFWLFFRREAFIAARTRRRARVARPGAGREPGLRAGGQRKPQGAGVRRAAPPGPGLPGLPRQRPATHR